MGEYRSGKELCGAPVLSLGNLTLHLGLVCTVAYVIIMISLLTDNFIICVNKYIKIGTKKCLSLDR